MADGQIAKILSKFGFEEVYQQSDRCKAAVFCF